MSTHFQAAILRETNAQLVIEELAVPALDDGQVLVELSHSGVCRSQLMEIQGFRGQDRWLPHLLGHEGSGRVLEVGPRVTKVISGDEVVIGWIKGTGISARTPSFKDKQGKLVNAGVATTFSTMSVISEDRLYKAPSGFAKEFLPLFGCALLTGGGMVLNHFDENKHQDVLILGFGGVGTSAAVVIDSFRNIHPVILEESRDRREQARQMGFTKVFSVKDAEFLELARSLGGFDLCLESAGSTVSIELGFSMLKPRGKLVFATHPEQGSRISLDPFELINGKQINGVYGGGADPDEDIETIGTLLLNSKLNLDEMLGKVFPLADVNLAIDYLRNGERGRPILRMQREGQ